MFYKLSLPLLLLFSLNCSAQTLSPINTDKIKDQPNKNGSAIIADGVNKTLNKDVKTQNNVVEKTDDEIIALFEGEKNKNETINKVNEKYTGPTVIPSTSLFNTYSIEYWSNYKNKR